MDGVGIHGNVFHWDVCQQERLPVLEAAAAPHLLRHRQQGCKDSTGRAREAFHTGTQRTVNNIPSICISYRHQCTFTSTPLSCTYTLGNVQIKSRSFKKNSVSHPVTMTRFTNLPSHGHNFYIQIIGNLKAVTHTGVFTPRNLQPPWWSPKAAEDVLCWQSPQSPQSLPNVPTLTTFLSTSYKFSLCWYNFSNLNLKEFHNNPVLFSQLRLERRFGSLPAR